MATADLYEYVGDFEIQLSLKKRLGSGATGQVFPGKNIKTGDHVAAKKMTMYKVDFDTGDFEQEADLLLNKIPEHRNIVKVYDFIKKEYIKDGVEMIDIWLITELCPLGNLKSYAQQRDLSIAEKIELMYQSSLAVHHLHEGCPEPVCHRDIKPENILVAEHSDGPVVKLCDLGGARTVIRKDERSVSMKTPGGTPCYAAPEQMHLKRKEITYNKTIDTYSLGMAHLSLLEAAKGKPMKAKTDKHGNPLAERLWENRNRLFRKYKPPIDAPTDSSIETQIKAIIKDIIKLKPSDRLPIAQVVERLSELRLSVPRLSVPRPAYKRPVKISEFVQHVIKLHKDANFGFAEEYEEIKQHSAQKPCEAAEFHVNRVKNRYTNILPFDDTRVKLLPYEDEEGSDYINGNYMMGYTSPHEFIAMQGPLPSTVDDFWRAIWEQKCSIIVMHTMCRERDRVKCEQYWPDRAPDHQMYGDIQVTLRSESHLGDYIIRTLDVRQHTETRTIKQFHFILWPPFGCPDRVDPLLMFVQVVRTHIGPDSPESCRPTVVHDSSGVGRTGVFIVVDRVLQHMQQHNKIDIFSIVMEMRGNRHHMVQTEDQYVYIHDCISDAIKQGLHLQPADTSKDKASNQESEPNKITEEEHIYENLPASNLPTRR